MSMQFCRSPINKSTFKYRIVLSIGVCSVIEGSTRNQGIPVQNNKVNRESALLYLSAEEAIDILLIYIYIYILHTQVLDRVHRMVCNSSEFPRRARAYG